VRHRKLRTKLHGTASSTHAMYNNMLSGLLAHGRIKTTERRARLLRRMAERLVTRATRLGDVLLKSKSKLSVEEKARMVHAMRLARRQLKQRDSVLHLFEEVAPRYIGRPGGYTRLCKLGFRKGDGAPMAILEFIEAEMPEREGEPTEKKSGEKKGRLSSLLGRKQKKEKVKAGKEAGGKEE
jgi:large subunit ribosomal protein L17